MVEVKQPTPNHGWHCAVVLVADLTAEGVEPVEIFYPMSHACHFGRLNILKTIIQLGQQHNVPLLGTSLPNERAITDICTGDDFTIRSLNRIRRDWRFCEWYAEELLSWK